MNKIQQFLSAVILIAVLGTISACKKTFDAPPGPGDVNIVANTSIQNLKSYHTIPGVYDLITQDVIISGIVVANDKSGNMYKQLFIQDTTGAIQLLVDAYSLYASYPVGRKVYVKCKGLTLTDSYSNMVLGYKAIVDGLPSIEGIPGAIVNDHLIGGSLNNPVEPLSVTINDLGTSLDNRYINALVKLDGYEFVAGDSSKTYGDTSSYKSTVNRLISLGCGSSLTTTVRTSGYANFAGIHVPTGNGSITAIYTIYRSSPTSSTTTKQLLLRDTSDVQFTNGRCGAPPPGTIVLLNEDFETQNATTTAPYNAVAINGWANISEIGARTYSAKIYNSNKYAYLTAYGATPTPAQVKTWLVTAGINMNNTTNETLSFTTQQDYSSNGPAALKILISNDGSYTGTGNPWTANWTDITAQATLCPPSASNFPGYTPSGNIDISSFSGTVYIAFVYDGTNPGSSSTWEIDDIRVLGL